MSPTVTMIPVEASPQWKEFVVFAGVCHISHKQVDIVLVCLGPFWVKSANSGCGQYMIAIMEVVVVVVGVSKINSRVSCLVTRRRDYTTPSSCDYRGQYLLVDYTPQRKGTYFRVPREIFACWPRMFQMPPSVDRAPFSPMLCLPATRGQHTVLLRI